MGVRRRDDRHRFHAGQTQGLVERRGPDRHVETGRPGFGLLRIPSHQGVHPVARRPQGPQVRPTPETGSHHDGTSITTHLNPHSSDTAPLRPGGPRRRRNNSRDFPPSDRHRAPGPGGSPFGAERRRRTDRAAPHQAVLGIVVGQAPMVGATLVPHGDVVARSSASEPGSWDRAAPRPAVAAGRRSPPEACRRFP